MNNEVSSVCLDLTRLVSRVGSGPMTGIDRVEFAYLSRFSGQEDKRLFGLARTSLGYVLLDKAGAIDLKLRLENKRDWGSADAYAMLHRRKNDARNRAEADLRRLSLGRATAAGLKRLLTRHLPAGTRYLNVGHSNLSSRMLKAMRAVSMSKVSVLIHDAIPITHPQFQRDGATARFARKLAAVSEHADLVICNSTATRDEIRPVLSQMGRIPQLCVAHLGVELPAAGQATDPVPIGVSRPYFMTIGTIEPRKNHQLLLDLWARLARRLPSGRIPHLVIAGRRGWKNEAVFARLDAERGTWLHELSGLDDAALVGLLEGAAGLLHPSVAEGFGLPPLEALSLGVPVVCAPLPVFRELMGDMPVYAELGELYQWEKAVLRLADEHMIEHHQNAMAAFNPPKWSDHFNTVLKVI